MTTEDHLSRARAEADAIVAAWNERDHAVYERLSDRLAAALARARQEALREAFVAVQMERLKHPNLKDEGDIAYAAAINDCLRVIDRLAAAETLPGGEK